MTLQAKERFITRLPAGALVGEAGLLSETGRRNATVRAAGTPGLDKPVEVLQLSKESFLDLDDETLRGIRETAAYNTACTKEPHLREPRPLQPAQPCTAPLQTSSPQGRSPFQHPSIQTHEKASTPMLLPHRVQGPRRSSISCSDARRTSSTSRSCRRSSTASCAA